MVLIFNIQQIVEEVRRCLGKSENENRKAFINECSENLEGEIELVQERHQASKRAI